MIMEPLSRAFRVLVFIFSFSLMFSAITLCVVAQTNKGPAAKRTSGKSSKSRAVKRERERGEREHTVSVLRNGKRVKVTIDLEKERFDEPEKAVQRYLERRLPKDAKQLPLERYFAAKDKIKRMKRFSSSRSKVIGSQLETGDTNVDIAATEIDKSKGFTAEGLNLGSTGGTLGTWQPLGPGNVGGRTRALIIDPTAPNVMYAGGVAGGIWKTTNGGASWSALDDFMANLAVTSLAFDPSNSNVIYAGTGEGFFNADGVRGAGIFKTTDAGITWTRLPATANNSNFFFVNDIVVGNGANSQHIYAATRTGVWRSLNGGANWTQVIASNAANGANGAMDLVIRTDQATDYVYAAVGTFAQSHIFRNTDAGGAGTWTDVYTEANMGRTSLAIAPSNQNVIYAMASCISCGAGTNPNFPTANYTDGLLAVFRSTSNGDTGTWTTQVRNNSPNIQDTLLLTNPVNGVLTQCGFGTSQFLNQGWYDSHLAVDPTDENKVWSGGVDLFRSDNGGVNWAVASYWWFQGNGTPPNNGDPQLVHADNHAIVFHPQYNGTTNQTLFIGNDGGVYKTDNAKVGNVGYVGGINPSGGTVTTASPICGNEFTPGGFFTVPSPVIWGPLNNGFGVTQFYHGAVYPDGQTFFGGTQDNGTNRGTIALGANAWARINGGDGGYVAVNPANTNTIFFETTGLSLRRSTNGGASSASVITGISGDTFPFITVFRMDPTTPTRLWIGGRFMWRTDNNATNWTRTSNAQQTGGSITAMAIAPTNSNVVITGAASGQLRRTTVGLTANAASVLNTTWLQTFTPRGNGNGSISWIEYDPTNANNLWATISNFNGTPNANGTSAGHVFRSTNGGANWTLADGTQTPGNVNAIPDIPAHSVVVDPNDGQRVYVGTDLGVFVTLDGGANWYQETTGFSNTVVESMSIHNIGGISTVYAFTHGRGAFRVSIPASCSTVGNATPQAFGSAGGSGTIAVSSSTIGCDWNSASNSSFITIDSGGSGTGSGSLGFTVAPNNTGLPRTGTITVAGRVVTISQKATTTITWNNPADIVYGTPLGATQLNATANVPGTFVYTPPAGTVLNAGSGQTLHVDFTPTDTANYEGSSKDVLINVNKALLNYAASGTSQYSDPLSVFTISFSGFVNGDTSAVVSGSPSCTTSVTSTSAPGPYSISCTNGTLTAANYDFSFSSGTYTVTQEDARATYAGQMYVSTGSMSASTATINLVATIQDITAVTGDLATDAYPGDIRNATVTFVDRDNGNAVFCSTGPIQLLDPADLKAGTGSCQWTTDIGSADSVSYSIGIVIGGYYTRNSSADDALVTVSKLIPGSIGGGGFLVNSSSGGAKAGDDGAKTHFGFNVRNNKKGSNFQGNVNFILVSGGRTYQIKSTAITSLVVKKGAGSDPSTAAFGGKGVIVDITNRTSPVTVDGNAQIQITMTDAGEPGTSDRLALTLWDKRGLLWFSSNWTGTRTIEQILGGGNLQVH